MHHFETPQDTKHTMKHATKKLSRLHSPIELSVDAEQASKKGMRTLRWSLSK